MTGMRFRLGHSRSQTVYANLSPSSHQSGKVLRSCRYREPTREEHLLVDRILLDPFNRADSGEERSHRAPMEMPENRVNLNPLETRFEIRKKTK
ncbi:hypothetical protein Bca52824_060160 [Brassica carinata]|uniref:Uncharacterized protein n=1 Tax=Brassica carinata TaxID=52824 RepID=A0A8X7UFC6_BRACI|nr:hypothetical protein Bca52824_060160 [Brassica carinata]